MSYPCPYLYVVRMKNAFGGMVTCFGNDYGGVDVLYVRQSHLTNHLKMMRALLRENDGVSSRVCFYVCLENGNGIDALIHELRSPFVDLYVSPVSPCYILW